MKLKIFPLPVLLLILLGLAACGRNAAPTARPSRTAPPEPTATKAPPSSTLTMTATVIPPPPTIASGLVDVGGYALFITCSGAGEPVVVLEAGSGYGAGEWWGELPKADDLVSAQCVEAAQDVAQDESGRAAPGATPGFDCRD